MDKVRCTIKEMMSQRKCWGTGKAYLSRRQWTTKRGTGKNVAVFTVTVEVGDKLND